jgi:hypothetical protein
VEELLSYVIK